MDNESGESMELMEEVHLNFPRYNVSNYMVDVRSVLPVLTCGTHFLSIPANQHQ